MLWFHSVAEMKHADRKMLPSNSEESQGRNHGGPRLSILLAPYMPITSFSHTARDDLPKNGVTQGGLGPLHQTAVRAIPTLTATGQTDLGIFPIQDFLR